MPVVAMLLSTCFSSCTLRIEHRGKQPAENRTRQRGDPGVYQHLDCLECLVASYHLTRELTRTDVKTRIIAALSQEGALGQSQAGVPLRCAAGVEDLQAGLELSLS